MISHMTRTNKRQSAARNPSSNPCKNLKTEWQLEDDRKKEIGFSLGKLGRKRKMKDAGEREDDGDYGGDKLEANSDRNKRFCKGDDVMFTTCKQKVYGLPTNETPSERKWNQAWEQQAKPCGQKSEKFEQPKGKQVPISKYLANVFN